MKNVLSFVAIVALLLVLGALTVIALPRGLDTATASAPASVAGAPASQEPAAPQSTTGYNWIAIPLNTFQAGDTAATLANHVQTNNNGTVTVQTVSRWNATAQGLDIYFHQLGLGDFPISNQSAYRVETTGPASAVWTMVGDVPAIGSYNYTLLETGGTDYNWIMDPLDRPSNSQASVLANDIQTNASAPVTVQTISKWNATAQSYDIYFHQLGLGDFDVRPGYPYRVEVDVTTGSSVSWP